MYELRYYQEVHAVAKDVQTLWLLKCRYIMQSLFQDPVALKIYFNGREEWLFDYLPTPREASKILAEASLPQFEVVKINNKCNRGRK